VGASGWRGDRGGRGGNSCDDDGRDDGGYRAKSPSSSAVGGCVFRLSVDNRYITTEREIWYLGLLGSQSHSLVEHPVRQLNDM